MKQVRLKSEMYHFTKTNLFTWLMEQTQARRGKLVFMTGFDKSELFVKQNESLMCYSLLFSPMFHVLFSNPASHSE